MPYIRTKTWVRVRRSWAVGTVHCELGTGSSVMVRGRKSDRDRVHCPDRTE